MTEFSNFLENKRIISVYSEGIKHAQVESQVAAVLLPIIVNRAVDMLTDTDYTQLITLAGDKLNNLQLSAEDLKAILGNTDFKASLKTMIQKTF